MHVQIEEVSKCNITILHYDQLSRQIDNFPQRHLENEGFIVITIFYSDQY